MMKLSFEVNGRKVNPKNVSNMLEAAVLSGIEDSIKKSVGTLRCSEHNQQPEIVVKGRNLESLSFEVSGCCENLKNLVVQKLK
ncbi:MAG: hypothetical protein ACPGUD_00635 [Parashewanella sp.]